LMKKTRLLNFGGYCLCQHTVK